MFSGIVYLVVGFELHTLRVQAAGEPRAEAVLCALLDDLAEQLGPARLDGIPRFIACGADPLPSPHAPWQEWVQSAAATLIVLESEEAAAHPAAQPAGTLTGERTGIIEYLTGPDSGFAHRLPVGAWTLGRGGGADVSLADPFLSRQRTAVRNAPSGIQVDGADGHRSIPLGCQPVLTDFGSTTVRISPPSAAAHPGHSGHAPSGALSWPQTDSVDRPRPPSWVMFIAPLLIGVALAVFTHMWMFLLFSLTGPVSAVIMWLTGRRRYRREVLAAVAAHRQAVRECLRRWEAADAASLQAAHRHRLTGGQVLLGLGAVLLPGGMGDLPVTDPAAGRQPDPLRLAASRAADRHLGGGTMLAGRCFRPADPAPLILDCTRIALDLDGPPAAVLEVLRSLIVQLHAAGRSVELTGPAAECPEFAAVPLGPQQTEHAELGGHPEHAVTMTTRVCAAGRWTAQIRPPGTGGGLSVRSPELWTLRLGDDGTGQLALPSAVPEALPRPVGGPVRLMRMRAERFIALNTAWQLRAAAWQQDTDLSELLEVCEQSAAGVPIGRGEDGTVRLDLFGAGPHALLAGTTGAGKSVLLQTWLASLAACFSPGQVRFVLIDFKGGAAFAPFAALAHTDAVVSNLDPAAGMRTLRCLRAEVLRREQLLAGAQAGDIDAYNARAEADGRPRLPRLVVMIDEFQALITEHPTGAEVLEALTALGRSLGIHVVLATQRPAGVVTPRMKANINLRIALRVRDGVDSREVIDCEDAAGLPADLPGLGCLTDGGPIRRFRTATLPLGRPGTEESGAAERSTGETGTAEAGPAVPGAAPEVGLTDVPIPQIVRTPVDWQPVIAAPWQAGAGETGAGEAGAGETGAGGRTMISHVHGTQSAALSVAGLATASRRQAEGLPPAHQVVPPVLPERLRAERPSHLGRLDFPDDGVSADWHYDPGRDGSLIISGGRGLGTSTVLRQAAHALAAAGRQVIVLSAHPTGPADHPLGPAGEQRGPGVVRSGAGWIGLAHEAPWTLEYLLGLFERGGLADRPLAVCIDDYEALAARHETSRRLDRLAQLLSAGGPRAPLFVIAAGRRFLHSPLASHAPTRIVFPPADAHDALHFGLPAGRFFGAWPPGRAVVLGPVARSRPAPRNAKEGVDVHLTLPASEPLGDPTAGAVDAAPGTPDTAAGSRPESRGLGLAHPSAVTSLPGLLHLGYGPLGEEICWDPVRDGRILTVRGPQQECTSLLTRLAAARDAQQQAAGAPPVERQEDPAAQPATGSAPVVLRDAHIADPATAAAAAEAAGCVLSLPTGTQLPYSSPLASGAGTGAQLILGIRQQGELAALGLRDLPVPPTGSAWFITGSTATPVQIDSVTADD